MEYIAWFEATVFSVWMRESGPAFFSSLVLHSIAMAFVAGVHVATDLRVLGVAPRIPVSLMRRFFPVMWANVGLVVVSGLLLLAAYPAKALTNPVFYLKLIAVAVALVITQWLATGWLADPAHDTLPAPREARQLAVVSLILWAAAITSGRLLAYTHSVMLASHVL